MLRFILDCSMAPFCSYFEGKLSWFTLHQNVLVQNHVLVALLVIKGFFQRFIRTLSIPCTLQALVWKGLSCLLASGDIYDRWCTTTTWPKVPSLSKCLSISQITILTGLLLCPQTPWCFVIMRLLTYLGVKPLTPFQKFYVKIEEPRRVE